MKFKNLRTFSYYYFYSSVFSFNLTFFYPQISVVTIPLFIFTTYKLFSHLIITTYKKSFYIGVLWGAFSFGGHFIWLLILLLNKSNASNLLSVLIYLGFVFYLSLTSGLWFVFSSFLLRKTQPLLFFILSLALYLYFLINYAGYILGTKVVYNFISPFISLVKCRYLLKLIWVVYFCINSCFSFYLKDKEGACKKDLSVFNSGIEINYIQPDKTSAYKQSPLFAGQRVYQKLSKLAGQNANKNRTKIIVAPESMFPFSLNKYPQIIEMWQSLLSDNEYLLLGGLRENQGNSYQSIYLISQCRIMQNYDKPSRVPFTENIFGPWKNLIRVENLFLNGKNKISKASLQKSFFEISDLNSSLPQRNFRITPFVCSDFFLSNNKEMQKRIKTDRSDLLILFANDSWFCSYFRNMMKNYVQLQSLRLNIPIIYISHFEFVAFLLGENIRI